MATLQHRWVVWHQMRETFVSWSWECLSELQIIWTISPFFQHVKENKAISLRWPQIVCRSCQGDKRRNDGKHWKVSSSCWRCLFSCWFETDVKEPTLLIVKNRGHSPRELRTTPDSVNMWSQWMRSVIEWYRQPVACCIWLPSRFIYGKEDIFLFFHP